MERIRVILILSIIGLIIFFSAGLFVGYKLFMPKVEERQTVNAQAILTALHDRGFLVTQTYIFDTPVTIDRSTGSAWKDFFFGQTIEARGTMEVNLGVDLGQVKQDDVTLNEESGQITVYIPSSKLFNARLVGPIELKNKEGILKRILDSDDGYNEALALLSKTAEEMSQREDLISRANDRAKDDISRILGYVAQEKTINVEIK
jgi:uncharacterized protein YneF (UPF0154 family)